MQAGFAFTNIRHDGSFTAQNPKSYLAEDTPSNFRQFISGFYRKTKRVDVDSGGKADFLFRGQSTDEPLIPRIARLVPKGNLPKVERLILNEFERLSLPFAEFEPKDRWDLLALAQHHGLPTRLLDWSYSALAALWFCVNKPPKKDEYGNQLDGVVWLFKTVVKDFINFPTEETPEVQRRTRIFRPRSITRRIMAQTGVFTCHIRTKEGRFVPLESNKFYKDRLVKIDIAANSFSEIRDQLDASGVSHVSLYPDLDGLARHLQFRYFHDEEPVGGNHVAGDVALGEGQTESTTVTH